MNNLSLEQATVIEIPGKGAKTEAEFPSRKEFLLYCARHSGAHLLAEAVQSIYPTAKFGVGPVVENGFYYDIELPTPLSDTDLVKIEDRMRESVRKEEAFTVREVSAKEAKAIFLEKGQKFKAELIDDIGDELITLFQQGEFVDLCRGPHVNNTKFLEHFKLTSASAAYWKGDQSRESMQRIYGTLWGTENELKEHLARLEAIKERDHRRIGEKLGLFTTMDFSPGCPILLPKGFIVYNLMSNYIRKAFTQNGYDEVRGPVMCHQKLWEKSGHWEKYKDNLFLIEGEKGDQYGLKPMNCPVHMSIYGMCKHSYRELPVRYHDQSVLHRNERSGTLTGLTRLRQFCQDDSHIFLAQSQIQSEITRILKLVDHVYTVFGMKYHIKLSTRPDNAMGSVEEWQMAEKALEDALKSNGKEYTINPKDGAFYGPKIDFDVEDAVGRKWQVATAQLDFQMPQRFKLKYIDAEGKEQTPVVIHNAVFGALERFFAILIESTKGDFPLWLAPEQIRIVPVNEEQASYAKSVAGKVKSNGYRVRIDAGNERLGKKIAVAETERVPLVAIVGKIEVANNTITLRERGGKEQKGITIDQLLQKLKSDAAEPSIPDLDI
jgi:threonyl-tRNA synthetase